ncbi:MAG: hypothetical protein IKE51_01875 [Solobacterium sp.]|nr:hypothetical protein [Solobacterium sp.]
MKKIFLWVLVYVVIAAGLLTWNLSGMDSSHGHEESSEHHEEGEHAESEHGGH